MDIVRKTETEFALYSIFVGGIIAILSSFVPITPLRALNALAIIQATFLSIIIAIYILGSQVILERYSPRILDVDSDEIFTWTVVFFGASIFFDLLALLYAEALFDSALLTLITIWLTFSLGVGAFFTLILVKDEIVGSAQPDAVSDLIRESITEDRFWEQMDKDGNSRPFYDEFEISRNALQRDDRQDSRNTLEALTTSLVNLSDSVFPPSDQRATSVFLGFSYIIDEFSTLANAVLEHDDDRSMEMTIESLCDISVDAVEAGFDRVSAQAVGEIYDISEQIIPQRLPETLVKPAWLSYREILGSAAENDALRTIGVTTNAISGLVADIEEDSNVLGSPSDKIAEILLQALFEGWETYLENHGESIPVSEVGYGDPKYFSGDLLDYEHSFNHFEENFQRCARSIFRIFSSKMGEARIIKIKETILNGIKDLGVVCAEMENDGLTYHFAMVLVFVGIGLDDEPSNIGGLLKEVSSINSTGFRAVNAAFSELRNFPDHNGPAPSHYLGREASKLYDDPEHFRNTLMAIELNIHN